MAVDEVAVQRMLPEYAHKIGEGPRDGNFVIGEEGARDEGARQRLDDKLIEVEEEHSADEPAHVEHQNAFFIIASFWRHREETRAIEKNNMLLGKPSFEFLVQGHHQAKVADFYRLRSVARPPTARSGHSQAAMDSESLLYDESDYLRRCTESDQSLPGPCGPALSPPAFSTPSLSLSPPSFPITVYPSSLSSLPPASTRYRDSQFSSGNEDDEDEDDIIRDSLEARLAAQTSPSPQRTESTPSRNAVLVKKTPRRSYHAGKTLPQCVLLSSFLP